MGGFWSGLFGGKNATLNSGISNTGQIAGFGAKTGQSDISDASSFWHSILSGDQAKTSAALAPEIAGIKNRQTQKVQTLGQFGNRGGGTNASVNASTDEATSQINQLIGGLTSGAADKLGSLGTSLLSTSLSGYGLQSEMSQQRLQNWMNSILGQATSSGVGFAEGFGLGKV